MRRSTAGRFEAPAWATVLPLLLLLLGPRAAPAADLQSLQRGTVTLGAGSSSVSVPLSPTVDPGKAFLVFGVGEDTGSPTNGQVTGQITGAGGSVTFERIGTAGSVEIKWYVAEFQAGIRVQRGSVQLPAVGNPADTVVPLTAVDPARSFPLISQRTNGGAFDSGDSYRAKLTNGGADLTLFAPDADTSSFVEWQVIEYQDASVQTGDLTFTNTDLTLPDTIPVAVNTAKSWLIYTHECTPAFCNGNVANIGSKLLQGRITGPTGLEFSRLNAGLAGESINLTWYVVEFTDATSVQHGTEVFNGSTSMATGSYTGNSTPGRTINVGFQPDVVIVKVDFQDGVNDDLSSAVIRTPSMGGANSKPMKGDQAPAGNMITGLTATGFTVGDDGRVNSNTYCGGVCTYYWTAFKSNADLVTGSYTGDGNPSQAISGLGFSPDYVLVMPANSTRTVQRFDQDTNSYQIWAGGALAGRVSSLDADGFTVGSTGAPNLNASGVAYHWVAWNEVAGRTKVGSYLGSGVSNRQVSGVGFQPGYVIVKGLAPDTYDPIQRSDAMPGTNSMNFRGAFATTQIRALQLDSFTLGSGTQSNNAGSSYAYVAFAGAPDGVRDVALSPVDPSAAIAVGGSYMRGGRSAMSADDNAGTGWFTLDITSSTNLRIARGATAADAGVGWFVIEFPNPLCTPVVTGFTDRSVASGLNTAGTKDGGVAWADFNADGFPDAAVNTDVNALGARTRLYISDGALPDPSFTDVTTCLAPGLEANVAERSVIWGDIDNDGDPDLARNAPGLLEIYKNNGPGAACSGWSQFGAAGSPSQTILTNNSEGVGFLDYDGDGDLDLVHDDNDLGIALYANDGTGFFTVVAPATSGLTTAGPSGDYLAVADIDGDKRVDLLDRRDAQPDLWLNGGAAPWFSAAGFDETAAQANKGGVAICDFDDDGDFDFFWSDGGTNQLWEQTGLNSGSFAARGVPTGIDPGGPEGIDGVACGDVDNDGDLDLLLTATGQDYLFRNDGTFAFTDVAPAGFGSDDGEGVAFSDYDRDGDLDVLINQDNANQLWRNDTDDANYLMVDARHDVDGIPGGTTREAIGANVLLRSCAGDVVGGVRGVGNARGHGSQDAMLVHYGLRSGCGGVSGPATTYVVQVNFVNGPSIIKAVTPSGLGSYALTITDTDASDVSACALTAVRLVSFTAAPLDGAVLLEWETGSEIDNLGFHLYRGTSASGPWQRVTPSLVPGLGSSPLGARYAYRDTGLANGVAYHYLLEDVETTGRTERHGPVSATPTATVGGEEEQDPADEAASRIAYGNPEANALRVVRQGGGVELELITEGFYAVPQPDGTVRLEVPGFQELLEPGSPVLPVKRTWVEAIAGRRVELGPVQARQIEGFAGLTPADAGAPQLEVHADGTIRAGQRRARRAYRHSRQLYPAEAARLLEVAFQGEMKKALVELSPLRWDDASAQLLLAKRLRVRVAFSGSEPGERALGGSRGRRAPMKGAEERSVVARLGTREAGLYGVRFEDLFPGGGRSLSTAELRLSRRGSGVAFHVEPNAKRFGPGSRLYFLGAGGEANPSGREAVYELELGAAGSLFGHESAAPRGPAQDVLWREGRWEQTRYYQATLLEAPDLFLWARVFAGQVWSTGFALGPIGESGEPGHLELWLQGGSDFDADPDHHVRVRVNGTPVAEVSWDGRRAQRVTGDLWPGVLREGTNLLEVENVGDTAAGNSVVFVDRFAVGDPGRPVAEGGIASGSFRGSGRAEVRGVGADAIAVDTTEESVPRWLSGAQATPGGLSLRVEAGHRYLVVDRAALETPSVRPGRPTGLRERTNGAEYLLVGPRAYLAEVEPLLSLRRDQGLVSRAVAIEEVFDEFGYGESRPEALREFLAYAYHEWQGARLRYVVLLGDASLDPQDLLGTGIPNPVPAPMLKSSYMWTASDPVYASINGEDLLPDVALGRLPASSAEEARRLVEKLVTWERAGWDLSGPVVLVADDHDAAGDFEGDAERVAETLLGDREVERIYVSRLGGATRTTIHAAFDRGASLVSYLGHGSLSAWASENVFNRSDLAQLAPQGQQPLVLTMNCLNGYFVPPATDALSEELIGAAGKGAIATFSPSGLSLHGAARRYHEALMRELVSGAHRRLGDAVLAAQAAYAETGSLPELLSLYHLFADPALVIR